MTKTRLLCTACAVHSNNRGREQCANMQIINAHIQLRIHYQNDVVPKGIILTSHCEEPRCYLIQTEQEHEAPILYPTFLDMLSQRCKCLIEAT